MKKILVSAIKWFGISVALSFVMLLVIPMFGVSDAIASRIGDAIIAYLPIAGVVLDIIERCIVAKKSENEVDETQLTTR